MKKIRVAILLASVIGILLVPGGAWAYTWLFNPATNHYYATAMANNTWEQAEAEALLAGGHLVTINDAAEESWLRSTFDDAYNYWIGFTDHQQEGAWGWASGEPVTYTNWAPSEPNNLSPADVGPEGQQYYTDEGEDYAVMNWIIDGAAYWNDVPNLGPWFAQGIGGVTGIIEVAPVHTPLPSTWLLVGPVLAGWLWRCRGRVWTRGDETPPCLR
jgi:hypothetical protein